jgi:hypothetical protein
MAPIPKSPKPVIFMTLKNSFFVGLFAMESTYLTFSHISLKFKQPPTKSKKM